MFDDPPAEGVVGVVDFVAADVGLGEAIGIVVEVLFAAVLEEVPLLVVALGGAADFGVLVHRLARAVLVDHIVEDGGVAAVVFSDLEPVAEAVEGVVFFAGEATGGGDVDVVGTGGVGVEAG